MKTYITVIKAIVTLFLIVAFILPSSASAQKYALKAYGDVGLGSAISLTTDLPGMTSTSSSNAFGVDFGYTFWLKNANRLEVNVGVGYRTASLNFDMPHFSYNYYAPATADEDGNPYQRFTTLSEVGQKISIGYFNIPIYLQYLYRAAKWIGIHADFGFGLGFKCLGKINATTGNASSYGVYPEYDNLVIDADYLNCFGETHLDTAITGAPNVNGFSASLLSGIGCEFYVGGSMSIDLGVRYNVGLTKVFSAQYAVGTASVITSENAPATYSVAQGLHFKALSDYVTNSHLNPFSMHIGVNVKF